MECTELAVKEILRYLQVPVEEADTVLIEEIKAMYQALQPYVRPQYAYQLGIIERQKGKLLFAGTARIIEGEDLKKLLKACDTCYVMAVTIGNGIDRQLHRLQQVSMKKAMIANACCNVMVEQLCDRTEALIQGELQEGQYLTMRYSPGYGDVPLTMHQLILEMLGRTHKIGITLTESKLLVPIKSITALIGVSNTKQNRERSCKDCYLNTSCSYRKRGEVCGSRNTK